jgi:hypothetical protein
MMTMRAADEGGADAAQQHTAGTADAHRPLAHRRKH